MGLFSVLLAVNVIITSAFEIDPSEIQQRIHNLQLLLSKQQHGKGLALANTTQTFDHSHDNLYELDLSTPTASPIQPNCLAYLKDFGLWSSQFIQCTVEYSRPFKFCEKCVTQYERTSHTFTEIIEVSIYLLFKYAIVFD